MLPGLGFSEILLLGVIALLVVGPKDLPLLLRKLGRYTAKMRALANEFRSGFDELARQAELDELRREMDAMRRSQLTENAEITEIRKQMAEITAEAHAPLGSSPAVADSGEPVIPPRPDETPPASPPAPVTPPPAPPESPPLSPPEQPPISPPAPDLPEPVKART